MHMFNINYFKHKFKYLQNVKIKQTISQLIILTSNKIFLVESLFRFKTFNRKVWRPGFRIK